MRLDEVAEQTEVRYYSKSKSVKPTVAWYESYHSYPGRPVRKVPDKNADMGVQEQTSQRWLAEPGRSQPRS